MAGRVGGIRERERLSSAKKEESQRCEQKTVAIPMLQRDELFAQISKEKSNQKVDFSKTAVIEDLKDEPVEKQPVKNGEKSNLENTMALSAFELQKPKRRERNRRNDFPIGWVVAAIGIVLVLILMIVSIVSTK